MKTFTIEISDTEYEVMKYSNIDPDDFVDYFVRESIRRASKEILDIAITKAVELGMQLPITQEDIINFAFDNEFIKTAQQRYDEASQLQ